MSPRQCRRRHRSITGPTSLKDSRLTPPHPTIALSSSFTSPSLLLPSSYSVARLSADEDDKLHPVLTPKTPSFPLHPPILPSFPPLMSFSVPLALFCSNHLCYSQRISTIPHMGSLSFSSCSFMSLFYLLLLFPLLCHTKPLSLARSLTLEQTHYRSLAQLGSALPFSGERTRRKRE